MNRKAKLVNTVETIYYTIDDLSGMAIKILSSLVKFSHNKITQPKEKKFVLRNSLLTDLFETNFRTIKIMSIVFFLFHFMNLCINDFIKYKEYINQNYLYSNF